MKDRCTRGVSVWQFGHEHSHDQSHVFTGEDGMWKKLLRVPLNLIEEAIIMVGIVVRQNQPLDSGVPRAFDGLQVA